MRERELYNGIRAGRGPQNDRILFYQAALPERHADSEGNRPRGGAGGLRSSVALAVRAEGSAGPSLRSPEGRQARADGDGAPGRHRDDEGSRSEGRFRQGENRGSGGGASADLRNGGGRGAGEARRGRRRRVYLANRILRYFQYQRGRFCRSHGGL